MTRLQFHKHTHTHTVLKKPLCACPCTHKHVDARFPWIPVNHSCQSGSHGGFHIWMQTNFLTNSIWAINLSSSNFVDLWRRNRGKKTWNVLKRFPAGWWLWYNSPESDAVPLNPCKKRLKICGPHVLDAEKRVSQKTQTVCCGGWLSRTKQRKIKAMKGSSCV